MYTLHRFGRGVLGYHGRRDTDYFDFDSGSGIKEERPRGFVNPGPLMGSE
jgi:hypothetical protein